MFGSAAILAAVLAVSSIPSVAWGLVSGEEHCVVDVVGQHSSGEFIMSDARCYQTLEEAMVDATNGAALETGDSMSRYEDPDELTVLAQSFTLGIHFDGLNGSGSSTTVTGVDCSGGYWNTGSAWANRISSSYNGCYRLRHYDDANKFGSSESTIGVGATHNLGALDNRTESVAYHSS